ARPPAPPAARERRAGRADVLRVPAAGGADGAAGTRLQPRGAVRGDLGRRRLPRPARDRRARPAPAREGRAAAGRAGAAAHGARGRLPPACVVGMAMRRAALTGLRARLLLGLLLTWAVTLAVVALALLQPLEQRLRSDALGTLARDARSARVALRGL